MVNIYVLELKNGKYYVGKTNHTFQRFGQHKSGSGAKWTQKHKVVDLFAFHKNMKDSDENKITIQMMKKYGARNVRGGSWTKVDMSDNEIRRLDNRVNKKKRTVKRRTSSYKKRHCSRCGRTSHTASKCYARFHANGKSLTKQKQISDKEFQKFFSFYKEQRKEVAAEDPSLNEKDVEQEVQELEKLSEESPEEVIQVMQSYSEEDESLSFNNLLSGTRYSLIEMIDEKIIDSMQNAADMVEKQVNKAVNKVNKSAKKLFKGIKKKF